MAVYASVCHGSVGAPISKVFEPDPRFKVPPVMVCNPAEPDTNTDINFPFDPVEGQGLRLVIGSPDAPGNFGFLRTGEDGGAKETAKNIGYDVPPSGCIGTNGVETEPGNMISVRAARSMV